MKDALMQIKEAALEAIKDQDDLEKINELRVKYLGKKGELTAILKGMGKLSKEERPVIGELANTVREAMLWKKRRKTCVPRHWMPSWPQKPLM